MLPFLTKVSISWGAKVHTSIGNYALELLKDNKAEAYDFYKNKNSQYFEHFLTGCVDPDKIETGAGTHYYVFPGKGTVNVGQYYPNAPRHVSDESARTRYDQHYKAALQAYKKGNKTEAFLQLGRAGHYIGDISCPAHSAGIQYPTDEAETNYHKIFETYCNNQVANVVHATSAAGYFGRFESDEGYYINQLCQTAAEQESNVLTTAEDKWMKAFDATNKYGEIYTAVLLEHFYNNVK